MTIIPQPMRPSALKFSTVKLAAGYSSAEGWSLKEWGIQSDVWVKLERNGYSVIVRGGIALAWLEMEGYFGRAERMSQQEPPRPASRH